MDIIKSSFRLRGVTVNVLALLHYVIHLSITNTSNYHYIQWCSPLWGSTKVTQSGELQGTKVTQIEYEGNSAKTNIIVSEQKSRPESILFTIYCALP